MNSVYKRYLIITLLGILLMSGLLVRSKLVMFSQMDAINEYVAEHKSLKGFETDNKRFLYRTVVGDESEGEWFPYFSLMQSDICYGDFPQLCLIALSIIAVLLYLYERGNSTGDFCAVLPVRARSAYLMKALCLALVMLSCCLVRIWAIHGFNMRVPACNETTKILMSSDHVMDMLMNVDIPIVLSSVYEFFTLGAILLFFGECTGKAYLPVCIYVLAVYAVTGSLSGADNFLYWYFDFRITGSVYPDRVVARQIFEIAVGVVAFLWGLYLAGRGDMSRKGRVFRFKWVENIAVLCVVLCGIFCGYEVIYVTEFCYSLTLPMCIMFMAVTGVVVYFVTRRIILWLGR